MSRTSRVAKTAGFAVRSNGRHLGHEILTIALFSLGAFFLFAFFSYSPHDPSGFSQGASTVHNVCGRVGAYVAAAALQIFGVGSFLLPPGALFLAVGIHRREGFRRSGMTVAGTLIGVISLTVFLSIQWKYWPLGGSLILTGGAFGAWLADAFVKQLNPGGATLISASVFLIALVVATPLSVVQVTGRVLAVTGNYTLRVARVIFSYTAYLLGLLAMRLFYRGGDLVGSWMRSRTASEKSEKEMRDVESEIELPIATVAKVTSPVLHLDADAEDRDEETDEDDSDLATNDAAVLNLENESDTKVTAAKTTRTGKRSGFEIIPPEAKGAKLAAKQARSLLKQSSGPWKLPTVEFLRNAPPNDSSFDSDKLKQNAQTLTQKFADFGIDGQVTAVRPGPVITLYEFKPGPGVKVSRIAALADDLSMALSAESVRILAPLPGKAVVGIEIPSDIRQKVLLREFLETPDFYSNKHQIPVVMGKDISGQPYFSDLARMPHLLCAGQTGAGKSVFMNTLICSLLYRFTPEELRLILVDPKFIEFRAYQDTPHLLLPVVDDPKNASTALKWAVREMDRRYRVLGKLGVRNLAAFNQKVDDMGGSVVKDLLMADEESHGPLAEGDWEAFEPDDSGSAKVGKLPYIVVIIDELADLMMVAKKEVEISIARIAQKARAAGIHLIIATQRPSTDVITGLIKANLPSRVSFQLASYIDSRTILDRPGAERLLGQGDMLFVPPGVSQMLRVHGAFVDDEEINKITGFLRAQGKPIYRDEILVDDEDSEGEDGDDDQDELFTQAIEIAKRSGQVSASSLQRHLKVGYNRAARMIETMESRGIVGPADGARPREVLVR